MLKTTHCWSDASRTALLPSPGVPTAARLRKVLTNDDLFSEAMKLGILSKDLHAEVGFENEEI